MRHASISGGYFTSLRATALSGRDRLVYGEDLADIDAALDLLARHIVDQRASNLLFGDQRRLQEDLLADAASTEVRKLLPKVRLPRWCSSAPAMKRFPLLPAFETITRDIRHHRDCRMAPLKI